MAKPKADAWLRESFRYGVDERYERGGDLFGAETAYPAAMRCCWLAQFDPRKLPCGGQPGKVFERFHFIPRQRVEAVVGERLPDRWELLEQLEAQMGEPDFWSGNYAATIAKAHGELVGSSTLQPLATLVLLAAWDPRNGGMGCELHHRRFDSHADSPAAPAIKVPYAHVPDHVIDFALDWGLERPFEERFGQRLIGLDEPQPSPPGR